MSDSIHEEQVRPALTGHLNTYKRFPLNLVRGQGRRVMDDQGTWYLDAFTGIGVMALGHGHPEVTRAVHAQVDALFHVSNLCHVPVQSGLIRRLSALYEGGVFLCNSGTEANEAAVKLARKHTGRLEVLCATGGFHGRTYMSLACTGRYHEGFGPMPSGVRHVQADQLASEVGPDTACVLVEPVQGEGGCIPLDLSGLREACEAAGALLIYDEVQCGLGRTGTMHHDPAPHVRTLAKALGGGLPLGAVVSQVDPFVPGDHGSTFGGNPIACAAACATLAVIERERLWERCELLGLRLRSGLEGLGLRVTGQGLMLAAHLGEPSGPVLERMRERGVLTCSSGPEAVRFLPAFTSTEEEIDEMVASLA